MAALRKRRAAKSAQIVMLEESFEEYCKAKKKKNCRETFYRWILHIHGKESVSAMIADLYWREHLMRKVVTRVAEICARTLNCIDEINARDARRR